MIQSGQKPSVTQLGSLVVFKNNSALAEEEALRVPNPVASLPKYIDRLSEHIETCWSDARIAKQDIEQKMLADQRQRNGIYETDKLSAIREMGGSEVYMLLTETKCRACEAHINAMLRPAGGIPFSIEPTPLADLPPDTAHAIKQEAQSVFQEVVRQVQSLGPAITMGEIAEEVREYAREMRDVALEEIREEAESRANRMQIKMTDQLLEGGAFKAFTEVISDMVTFRAGIFKGPVIRKRKRHKWGKSPQSASWEVQIVDELVPEFVRVSPFDIYPAPDSTGPDDGYLIERHKLSRAELNAMIGVPGYNDDYIRKALADYGNGYSNTLAVDTERAQVEFSAGSSVITKSEKIEALEFWGSVSGEVLLDWGYEGAVEPTQEYEINAWKVGQYVIRAILNPDKLGRKPYSVDSYERITGSFWGKGIPPLMADVQDVCNAIARSIVNNAAMSSGPQVEYDADRLDGESDTMHPWKMWPSTNRQMQEGSAVKFYQPQIIVAELLQAFEFFSAQAEDATGVPRWAYGNTNLGGAGSTSSGLHSLMESASKGFQEFVSHIDSMVGGCTERLYDYNMLYDPDQSIKGDCRSVSRGSQALIAKESQVIRMRELLAMLNNPVDNQIIGLDGRTELLRETMKRMDMPVKEILPSETKLKKIIARAEQMQMQQMQQQISKAQPGISPPGGSQPGSGMSPPSAPQTLDLAGRPAGSPDNPMQNQPGFTPGIEARAGGGPVEAGRPYLVGENGPELIVPYGNGVVVPAPLTEQFMRGSSDVVDSIRSRQRSEDLRDEINMGSAVVGTDAALTMGALGLKKAALRGVAAAAGAAIPGGLITEGLAPDELNAIDEERKIREFSGHGFGNRTDGTPKGNGWLGVIPMTDGSGRVMTELSMSTNMDGKDLLVPLIVPTLTKAEVKHLASGKKPTKEIKDKALDFAARRVERGLSPFYD